MFRCPFCGQAHTINIDDLDHSCYVRQGQTDIWEDQFDKSLVKLEISDKDVLIFNNDTEGTPHEWYSDLGLETDWFSCPKCGSSFWIKHWIECHKDPLQYRFESADLCDMCGEEMAWDQIPNSTKYQLMCSNCDWVKPNKTIDGA